MSELVFVRLGEELVPYQEGWDLQKRLHRARVADVVPDTVLLLQHQSVYTAGKRTGRQDRPITDPGAPVVDIDRGGKITWHGPGQLTGYPIVKLPDPIDVVAYVRLLEEALIRTLAELGLAGVRVDGGDHNKTGVWLPADFSHGSLVDRKIAAIGCRVSRGVAMHGFALNCNNDLSWFERIVPCGIPVSEGDVTSLSQELDRDVTPAEVVPIVERHLAEVLEATSYTSRDGFSAALGEERPGSPDPAAATATAGASANPAA